MPVSVSVMNTDNTGNVYMVYRGFGSDTRIWGTWFNGVNFNGRNDPWSQAENINDGQANSAPTVAFVPEVPADAENPIPFADRLVVTALGTDNNIWSNGQIVGANSWSNWTPILGQATNANRTLVSGAVAPGAQVFVAVNQNTDGSETFVMSALDSNHVPEYATFNTTFAQLTDWTLDTTGFQSNETPELTTNGSSTFSLITGLDDLAYWKPEFHE
jgi:hypothetical protein